MMQQYFKDIVTGIETNILENPSGISPRKRFALEIARLGNRLYSENQRVAWCGVAAPFDLLNAMGVTSCFVEFIGAMLASTGTIGPMLEEAQHAGYSSDTCGYHRAVLGAARKDVMPVPDFLIATSCPCSGGLASIENLALQFRKDLFVLQVPQSRSQESVRYLAYQIRDMVNFVTQHTGESLDPEQIRNNVENTNKARDLMIEAFQLVQEAPSPVNGKDLNNFGIVMSLFLGTEAAIEIAQAYRDEFTKRIQAGQSGVEGERFRLMWIQNRIQFKNPLISLLEKEYKASIVIDELNDITWEALDPDDPYTGMAQRAISIPLNGEIRFRIKHLQKLAQAYRIDGAINPCHWGCRQGTGARGLIEEGLKEIGVPVLNLEVDCVDSRNFAEGPLTTRLEAFLEMIEHRPSPW